MGKIGETKGGDPTRGVGSVVPLRPKQPAKISVEAPENKAETRQAPEFFDPNSSKELVVPENSGTVARGANLKARLTALGVRGAENLPIKGRDAVRVKDTPIGKILEGSVVIESAKAMAKLEGVVRVSGDLTVQETHLAGGDATPATSLVEIGGRLTIEGVS